MSHRIESLESRRLLSAIATLDGPSVPPTVPSAIVRGNVFRDANSNGTRESTEVGQPGIKVYLDYNNNGTRDGDAEPIAITNSLGSYLFEHAKAPATIPVRLLLTGTNFVQTRPSMNAARTVTTTVGGNFELESFGVAEKPAPTPTTAMVTGNVFYDKNENAARDPNEFGRGNVRVYLDLNNDQTREEGEPTTLTNEFGQYRFDKAPAVPELHIRLDLTGTPLRQTLPTGNGARVLATVAGHTYFDQNFGVHEVPPPPVVTGTIRGRVFADADHDGVFDTTEHGLSRAFVYLDLDHSGAPNDGEPRAATNFEGRYVFEHVPVGTYDVRLVRAGLVQTSPPDNGGYVANVVAGGTVGDLNFGAYRVEPTPVTIAGNSLIGDLVGGDSLHRFDPAGLLA